MRIAIVSDIHDNLTAFQAVLADLRETSPDLVLHGGDLVSGGSSPAEVVDRVRDLGWRGVFGNTDEAIARPETLEEFARQSPLPRSLWDAVREMTAFTREALGKERIVWLGALPQVVIHPPVALVHASPASAWRSPIAGQLMRNSNRRICRSGRRSPSTAIFTSRSCGTWPSLR
jgi:hypothetical protein